MIFLKLFHLLLPYLFFSLLSFFFNSTNYQLKIFTLLSLQLVNIHPTFPFSHYYRIYSSFQMIITLTIKARISVRIVRRIRTKNRTALKRWIFQRVWKVSFSLETRLDAFDGSIRQAKGGNSTRSKFRLTINIVTFDGGDDDRDRAVGKWKRGINRGIVHTGDACWYRSLVSILSEFIFRIGVRTCKVWKRQMALWSRYWGWI